MSAPPAKPWERSGAATTAAGSDPAAPKPWEQAGASALTSPISADVAAAGTQPTRPWERQGITSNGYTSTSYGSRPGMYGTGAAGPYGTSTYGSTYNSPYGSSYGSGMYGSGMYGSSYGSSYGTGSMYGAGGMYGSGGLYGSTGGMYGSSMYGGGGMYGAGGMYGSGGMYGMRPGFGGGMYGQPGFGGPGAMGGPFDPNAPPPQPPTAWQAVLAGINGVMMFFGRLSFLVDENAHAVHFFISALLQLLDRAGSLYGEIARFILRVIFKRKRPPPQLGKGQLALPPGAPGAAADAAAAAAAGRLHFPGRPGAPAAAAAGFGAAWSPPALPGSSMPASGDLPAGGHWENLWGDS